MMIIQICTYILVNCLSIIIKTLNIMIPKILHQTSKLKILTSKLCSKQIFIIINDYILMIIVQSCFH